MHLMHLLQAMDAINLHILRYADLPESTDEVNPAPPNIDAAKQGVRLRF